MSFKNKDEKNRFIEVEVHETGEDPSLDTHADMERPVDLGTEEEAEAYRTRERDRYAQPYRRKNKFGWAFFLASLFIGLGVTATTGNPLGLFVGLGLGFLFFVDPIYNKAMDWIERL
ncbi:MAG: hypothetical protein D6722_15100 [Bacteroidetes bacterium]|nr:MAG: hypothetical protein D6722_15100 [Bacteroidota bacterium]